MFNACLFRCQVPVSLFNHGGQSLSHPLRWIQQVNHGTSWYLATSVFPSLTRHKPIEPLTELQLYDPKVDKKTSKWSKFTPWLVLFASASDEDQPSASESYGRVKNLGIYSEYMAMLNMNQGIWGIGCGVSLFELTSIFLVASTMFYYVPYGLYLVIINHLQ